MGLFENPNYFKTENEATEALKVANKRVIIAVEEQIVEDENSDIKSEIDIQIKNNLSREKFKYKNSVNNCSFISYRTFNNQFLFHIKVIITACCGYLLAQSLIYLVTLLEFLISGKQSYSGLLSHNVIIVISWLLLFEAIFKIALSGSLLHLTWKPRRLGLVLFICIHFIEILFNISIFRWSKRLYFINDKYTLFSVTRASSIAYSMVNLVCFLLTIMEYRYEFG